MYIPYNTRKDYHKSVFGAVKQNESVIFRLVLPRDMGCRGVTLVIRSCDEKRGEGFRHYFSWERMEKDTEEWWRLEYTPALPGLYLYYFECVTPWGNVPVTSAGGGLGAFSSDGGEFQLTVYGEGFTTPDFLKGGIMYQIFPDRFFFSGEKKSCPSDRIIREDTDGEPFWRATPEGKVKNNDYFGGDIRGIIMKLPYLSSLGVSCIYLNPVFEANSNHRYDTADYSKIDMLLGTEDDLRELCEKGKSMGISVILDGVFSHTGDDSIYFNKYGRYDSLGAYQSEKSPYYNWYTFESYPDKYASWWNIDILPEVKENEPTYLDFITGENGIVTKWLRDGISGWRLDVADELPDEFLDAFRERVKKEKRDAVIIGEVWEDASNKSSYGKNRRYLQGKQLDSVMNYPFANAVLTFIRTGRAEGFTDKIMTVLENYPKQVVDVLMNHIGTHDTVRALTYLSGEDCEGRDRQWQSEKHLTVEQYDTGIELMKLASLIQFTLPGVPCVYYGDEAGMEGYKDPFNRFCYPWGRENTQLISWYRALGKFRREHSVFVDGEFVPLSEKDGCIAYERRNGKETVTVIINRNKEDIVYRTDEKHLCGRLLFAGEKTENGIKMKGLSGSVICTGK